MRTILIISIALMSITPLMAQNPMTQNSNSIELEKQATDLTEKYNNQLALRGKQMNLFKIKVEEFLINEQKIRNSDLPTEKKIIELQKNRKMETADMGDILTRPQLKLYKKLKSDYQPLEPVVVREATDQK